MPRSSTRVPIAVTWVHAAIAPQRFLLRLVAGVLFGSGVTAMAAEGGPAWDRFRGEHGAGIGSGTFPTFFGPSSNVVWKASLPAGNSSPCLSRDRLFLTAFSENQLLTLCLEANTGRELWRRGLSAGKVERGAALGSPATATPAVSGDRVCVYFGAFGLACYDLTGAELWRRPLPVPITQHGSGTSPVAANDLFLLNCDQDVGSYLLAVDQRTGRTVWQVDRAAFRRGFATPLPFPTEKPDQLIVPGTLRLVAYNLRDGSERWSVHGLPNEMVSSPVAAEDLIFIAGWTYGSGVSRMPKFDALLEQGDTNRDGKLTRDEAPPGPARQHFVYIDADRDGLITRSEYEAIARIFDQSRNVGLAVRPDGHGDVTDTHVLWRITRGLPYVPTPLFFEGRLYLVKNGGLASCFEARTGRVLYQEERLGGLGDYYSSPVGADGKVCVINQGGTAVVFRAGDSLEVLARNPLGESVLATPAIRDGRIHVRTTTTLYAFGERPRP